jgi:hypothetical protein
VNGVPATNFEHVTQHIESSSLELTIIRDKKEMGVNVPTALLESSGTERILGWSGAIFQSMSFCEKFL